MLRYRVNGVTSFSPCVQWCHTAILDKGGLVAPLLSIIGAVNVALADTFDFITDDTYYSKMYVGDESVANYPSMFNLFGNLLAGRNIELPFIQWGTATEYVQSSAENVVTIDGKLTSDSIDKNQLEELNGFAIEHGLVHSSVYVIAKAVIEDLRIKRISAVLQDYEFKRLNLIQYLEAAHRKWNVAVAFNYGAIAKEYIRDKISGDFKVYTRKTMEMEWELRLLNETRPYFSPDGSTMTNGVYEEFLSTGEFLQNAVGTLVDVYMSMVFGVLGGALGTYLSGGNPVGAYIGYVIGSFVGHLVGQYAMPALNWGNNFVLQNAGDFALTFYQINTGQWWLLFD